ncbi:MAG: NAD(P)/FAD-dependent oxidoreductase [Planctomycetia bacterium]|nr:NAD(P)/FAD-dependent oxidoreductase [Planctomycetia bacterium]
MVISEPYDTIIIGAGMSGLAAGIRLAHYDQRVCILERHTTIGGLNSFYRLGGRVLDVGLHAVTNYAPKGDRRGPLARLLRQLRIRWDDFALAPQVGSEIAFPGVRLRFSNDMAVFESEIEKHFPDQADNFRRLVAAIVDYDQLDGDSGRSARAEVARHVTDPLLAEMIFCPLLFYGGAREHDMDFHHFCVMFRAIFMEGLARPFAGVRLILNKLVRQFKSLGGELRLRAGVRRIAVNGERVEKVVLEDGTELTARRVLSSAGWHETMRLCQQEDESRLEGGMSFLESISILDTEPKALGHDRTIVFFNDSNRFHYETPDELVDTRSGMVCSPNNFAYDEPLGEGCMRVSSLANFERWAALDEESYRVAKLRWYDRTVAAAVRFVPDFRSAVIATDVFTPRTITRFTGHQRGAIYGAPRKRHDGRTHLDNLFICGADQGLVGIVGTLLSGIVVANRHMLAGGAGD